jgi:6-phosphogluconolactonase
VTIQLYLVAAKWIRIVVAIRTLVSGEGHMYIPTHRATFGFPFILIVLACLAGCGGSPTMQNSHCSACQFLYATTNSGQILTFPVNLAGGALGTPTSVAGPANSGGLLTLAPFSVFSLYLYVSDPQDSAIHVYTISQADGTLSPARVGPFSLGSGNGTPGEIAGGGNAIYVAGSTGNIVAFNVNADGSLTGIAGSPFAAGMGLSHLALIPSASVGNTNFLYAANSGDPNGSISAFNVTPSGGLVPVPGSPFPTLSGAGPEGFYDGGKFLYVALSNANAVAAFAIAKDGSLTPLAGSPFPAGRGTFSLTAAGGFLFATNNLDGTISSYSMDPVSGTLAEVAGSPFPGVVASGDTLYSNGGLFVPDASSNSIVGFAPNLSTGTVTSMMGSPFQAGFGPVALASWRFPTVDPPGH